jgi:hypothetical protein
MGESVCEPVTPATPATPAIPVKPVIKKSKKQMHLSETAPAFFVVRSDE